MARIIPSIAHFSRDVRHAKTESHRVYRRLAVIFLLTIVATSICAQAIYQLERHASGSDIKSYGTAWFWSASQLLTLGSALSNPVTTGGRVLAVLMDIYAVVVFATISGS